MKNGRPLSKIGLSVVALTSFARFAVDQIPRDKRKSAVAVDFDAGGVFEWKASHLEEDSSEEDSSGGEDSFGGQVSSTENSVDRDATVAA